MNKLSRRLLWIGGGIVVAGVAVVLALPALVDVNRYRAAIEAQVEDVLGRDVRLGEMRLSIFPLAVNVRDIGVAALPEEGGGDLLTASNLRVGARLFPLLRKRLEVTSVVVQEPTLVLERAADGSWNVQRLVATGDAPEAPEAGAGPAGSPPLSVDSIRVSGGLVTVRAVSPDGPIETRISGLDLTLTDLALDRQVGVDLAAELSAGEGAQLRLQGAVGPFVPPPGQPFQVAGNIEVTGISPRELQSWMQALGAALLPAGFLADRPVSGSVTIDASLPTEQRLDTRIDISHLALRDLDLAVVRGRDGAWNFEPLLEKPAGGGGTKAAAPRTITLAGIEIGNARIRVRDEAAASGPREWSLEGTDLTLDRLPTDGASKVRLATELRSQAGSGGLRVEGSLGPVPSGEGATPADLFIELEGIPLDAVGPILRDQLGVELASGMLDLSAKVVGEVPDAFQLSGTLDLGGVRAGIRRPDGSTRELPVDVEVWYDLSSRERGGILDLKEVNLTTGGNDLNITGSVRLSGRLPRVDLALAPTEVEADDLAGVLAILGTELPVSFTAGSPLQVQAAVKGEVGGESYPDVSGSLALSDFAFRHPSMSQPMEEVRANISLAGQEIEVKDFAARVGGSDVSGGLKLVGFTSPRVKFDVRSRNADFNELISFVRREEDPSAAGGGRPAPTEETILDRVVADGTLLIEQGSFGPMRFSGLDAGLALEGRRLTLDPFRMGLYEGRFLGTVVVDLSKDPPQFRIRSDVEEVDVDGLLTDSLEMAGVLSGRFAGKLEARGAGADYETVVRSLSGGGTIAIRGGRLGKLDVLGVVSQASGVFGEQTLQSLSQKMGTEGTDFQRLSATLRLGGPDVRTPDLLLESEDLVVKGEGTLDLIDTTLDGEFQVLFSRAVSESMRAEGSNAAKAFWDPARGQVVLPMTVSGPVSSLTPGVDWGTAAGNVARNRVQEELRGRLGGQVSNLLGGDARTEPAPSAPATGGAGLSAEITRTRWGGSFLLKDLKVEGVVRGERIDHASFEVRDADGKVLRRIDRLPEVDGYFASGIAREPHAVIRWDADVDGKVLASAREPFTVVVAVVDTEGKQFETRVDVRR